MKEQKIVIIGAGGHATVVCDSLMLSLKQGGGGTIVGFVDDDLRLSGKSLLGFPILGPVESLVDLEFDSLIVAILQQNKDADQCPQRSADPQSDQSKQHVENPLP